MEHPRDWRWCSYDELTGVRKRYRVVNLERLLSLTGYPTLAEFGDVHAARVQEHLTERRRGREAWWTESVAIGDREFAREAEQTVSYRQSMEAHELDSSQSEQVWVVREQPSSYTTNSKPKPGI